MLGHIWGYKMDNETSKYSRLIDDMLTDETFEKATNYLLSVKRFIKNNDKMTEKQKTGINNIYMKFSGNAK